MNRLQGSDAREICVSRVYNNLKGCLGNWDMTVKEKGLMPLNKSGPSTNTKIMSTRFGPKGFNNPSLKEGPKVYTCTKGKRVDSSRKIGPGVRLGEYIKVNGPKDNNLQMDQKRGPILNKNNGGDGKIRKGQTGL